MIHTTFTCPRCFTEIEVSGHVNEECDLGEECPECGYKFTDSDIAKAYDALQDQAIANAERWAEGDR